MKTRRSALSDGASRRPTDAPEEAMQSFAETRPRDTVDGDYAEFCWESARATVESGVREELVGRAPGVSIDKIEFFANEVGETYHPNADRYLTINELIARHLKRCKRRNARKSQAMKTDVPTAQHRPRSRTPRGRARRANSNRRASGDSDGERPTPSDLGPTAPTSNGSSDASGPSDEPAHQAHCVVDAAVCRVDDLAPRRRLDEVLRDPLFGGGGES